MRARATRILLAVLLVSSEAAIAGAEAQKAFAVTHDAFGPVYQVDMKRVKSAAELAAVPGVKLAWDLRATPPTGWLGSACDVEPDGRIDLFIAIQGKEGRRVARYDQSGRRIWTSEDIGDGLGHESGMAVEDLDRDGSYELIFNVDRALWCLAAETGEPKWIVQLPRCRDNYQASVVGHFLSPERSSVVCRVYHEVSCYNEFGKKVWTYRIDNHSAYGHEMTHYDVEGDGRDEVFVSLNGKLVALRGTGTLLWADASCRNHSDFVLAGDVAGRGTLQVVYDRDGCAAMRGPIACVAGRSGALLHLWRYARPGKDHLQRAVLGDFDPSHPGEELAAVGKRQGSGGLLLWSQPGAPAWRRDIATGWVTWGDWNGDGTPEILVSGGVEGNERWEVWSGTGTRLYAIAGVGGIPLGVESAGRRQQDIDGNGKAETLLETGRSFLILMEAP